MSEYVGDFFLISRPVPYPEQIASMIFWLPDVLEPTQAVVSSILPKIETFAHYMAIMALLLLGTNHSPCFYA